MAARARFTCGSGDRKSEATRRFRAKRCSRLDPEWAPGSPEENPSKQQSKWSYDPDARDKRNDPAENGGLSVLRGYRRGRGFFWGGFFPPQGEGEGSTPLFKSTPKKNNQKRRGKPGAPPPTT